MLIVGMLLVAVPAEGLQWQYPCEVQCTCIGTKQPLFRAACSTGMHTTGVTACSVAAAELILGEY